MSKVSLYNFETGKLDQVDESEVAPLILAQTHSPIKDQPLDFIDKDTGSAFSVPDEHIIATLQQGHGIETSAQRVKRFEAEEFGEGFAPAKAAALATFRGITQGTGDHIITKLGVESPETLSKLKEYNPKLSLGFEIGGAFAPLLVPGAGPIAATVKAAGILPRASVAGAELVAKGAAKLLPKAGTSIASRAIAKVVPKAVEGAVEGALFATGQVISEDALGETELVSQKALDTITLGALLGGGVGLGIGAGSFVSGEVSSKISGALASRAAKKADDAASIVDGKQTPWIEKTRQDNLRKSYVGNQGKTGDKIYDKWGDEQVEAFTKKHNIVQSFDAPESTVGRIEAAGEKIRGELDAFAAKLPKEKNIGVNLEKVRTRLGDMITDLEKQGGTSESVRLVRGAIKETKQLEKIHMADVINFDDAIGTRNRISNTINWTADNSASISTKKAIKAAWADAIDDAAEPFMKDIGGADAWKALRTEIKLHDDLLKLATQNAAKGARQNTLSLTGKLTTGFVGAGVQSAGGALLPSWVTGLAAGAVTQMGRARMPSTVYNMLSKAGALSAIEKSMVQTNKKLARAVEIFGEKAAPIGPIAAGSMSSQNNKTQPRRPPPARREQYHDKRKKVAQLLQNPQLLVDRVEAGLGQLKDSAPKIATAMTKTATRGLAYLEQVAPKDPIENRVFGKFEPSDSEIAKYERIEAAINTPTDIIDKLNDGTLTRDEVAAVRTVHPELYQHMVSQLVEKVTKLGDNIPYQSRVALGILFDVPLDATMRPEFVAAYQKYFAAPTQAPQQGAKIDLSAIRSDKYAPRSAQIAGSLA